MGARGGVTDIFMEGASDHSDILGGGDNKLACKWCYSGPTLTLCGDIVDTSAGGYLEVIKTGTGVQTLTGNLDMVSDTGSVLNVHEGTHT